MEKYEIQRLRDLSIEQVAEQLGLQVARHKSLCPFHDDHHASLTFSPRRNSCRCYVCMTQPMGTIDLVMRHLHLDFPKACHWLADKGGVYLSEERRVKSEELSEERKVKSEETTFCGRSEIQFNTQKANHKVQLSTFNVQRKKDFDSARYAHFFEHPWLSAEARRFLFEERRLDERVVRWCRLSSWQDRDGTHWLQIPYFDQQGELIGMQNRNLDYKRSSHTDAAKESSEKESSEKEGSEKQQAEKPRFRFPYGAKCSIYNLPVLNLLQEGEPLYITEGCSDCWAMLSSGHKAIAIPSATLLKPEDRQLLSEVSERLHTEWHMYPDRDAPGERLFLQLQEMLPTLQHHQLPPGCKDYGEAFLNL